MKTLALITILFLFGCKAKPVTDPYKTFRTVKVQEIKLKKSKLAKEYRFNELSKRDKKQKSHKQGKIKCINLATYTNKSPMHYLKASQKINPEYLCTPN